MKGPFSVCDRWRVGRDEHRLCDAATRRLCMLRCSSAGHRPHSAGGELPLRTTKADGAGATVMLPESRGESRPLGMDGVDGLSLHRATPRPKHVQVQARCSRWGCRTGALTEQSPPRRGR